MHTATRPWKECAIAHAHSTGALADGASSPSSDRAALAKYPWLHGYMEAKATPSPKLKSKEEVGLDSQPHPDTDSEGEAQENDMDSAVDTLFQELELKRQQWHLQHQVVR